MIFNSLAILNKLNLTRKERNAIHLASIGSVLEFYDFIIFGFMSYNFILDVFGNGAFNYHVNLILTFTALLFGYLIRPLGMRLYTKVAPVQEMYIVEAMIATLFITATCLLALIPEHHYTLAIFILFTSRLIQGVASGAEMQSNIDLLQIRVPEKINYSIFGIISGNELGILIGVVINRLINLCLTQEQMISYGWRGTFLVAAIICAIIYWLRYQYSDPVTEQYCYRDIMPLYKLIIKCPKQIMVSTVFSAFRGSTTFLLLFIVPFYLFHECHYDLKSTSGIFMTASVINFSSGYLLNNFILYNRNIHYKVILRVALCLILLSIPVLMFLCYAFINKDHVLLSVVIASIITGCFRFVLPFLALGVFSSETFLAGYNFSNHLGFLIGGVLVIIINFIFAMGLNIFLPDLNFIKLYYSAIALYLLVICLLSIKGILYLNRNMNVENISRFRALLLNIQEKS